MFAFLAGAAMLVVGTWLVAVRVQSPAQREAAAAPPSAGPVTVAVTRSDLVEQTTFLATAVRSESVTVAVPTPFEGQGVVTRSAAAVGHSVPSGGVVVWVNSRPVIALQGEFALYRDLYLGARGDDVRMIQQALADLGYAVSVDGELGRATAAAIRELYRSAGAQAPQDSEYSPSAVAAEPAPSEGATAAASPAQPTLVLPASEVIIVPTLPAVLTSVPATGTAVDGEAAATFSTQEIALTATVPPTIQARLTSGLAGTASLQGQSADMSMDVALAQVNFPQQDALSPTQQDQEEAAESAEASVVLRASDGHIPDDWVGRSDVLVTLNLSEPVLDALLVPQRAVSADVNGVTTVLVEQKDGSFTQVVVTELGCVAGTCAVDAEDGTLTEDMSVRVDG
ncbi:peptidoglycan-binding domain-containing protein [Actinomyces succiniciruminis]|uniref:peptidoglycan-binding domain-containing protein n=1 Tax=Actinomyces succiniciruminis TaxID=1522002 RepID=UPI001B31F4F3|nr:peptidoglycan-binding domain-containing protein [Actinomyces succiniciruminis]